MRKRVLLSFLVVALAAFIAVGSAGAGSPPNRLDDNRAQRQCRRASPADVCNAILGPFQVFSWFDLDVCPTCTRASCVDPAHLERLRERQLGRPHSAAASKAAINDLTRKIIDTSAGNDYFGPAIHYGINPPTFAGSSQNDGCTRRPRRHDESAVDRALDHVRGPGARHRGSAPRQQHDLRALPAGNGRHQQRAVRWDVRQLRPPTTCSRWRSRSTGPISIPPFDVHLKSYPYAVIPLKCAKSCATRRSWHRHVASRPRRSARRGPTDGAHQPRDHRGCHRPDQPRRLGRQLDLQPQRRLPEGRRGGRHLRVRIGPAGDVRTAGSRTGSSSSLTGRTADNAVRADAAQAEARDESAFRTAARPTSPAWRSSMTPPSTPSTCRRPSTRRRRPRAVDVPLADVGDTRRPVRHRATGRTSTPITIDTTSTAIYGKQYRLTVNTSPGTVQPTVTHAEPVGRRQARRSMSPRTRSSRPGSTGTASTAGAATSPTSSRAPTFS